MRLYEIENYYPDDSDYTPYLRDSGSSYHKGKMGDGMRISVRDEGTQHTEILVKTKDNELIARMSLDLLFISSLDQRIHSVENVFLDVKYRRRGLGYKLYEWLIRRYGVLMSDQYQSVSAKHIWSKIAKNYDVRLYNNYGGISKKPLVNVGKAYENESTRLIAFNRPTKIQTF